MSWFLYGDADKRYRRGIYLRIRSLPKPLLAKVAKGMRTGESPIRLVVHEVRDGEVVLESWTAESPLADRYTVAYFLAQEDLRWVCEGDLGRGLVDPTKKSPRRKRA